MANIRGLKFTYGIKLKGGPGSGHHGHAGRPGQVGGSASSGSAQNWSDYTTELDEEFGEWSENNVKALRLQMTNEMSDVVSSAVKQHLRAERLDFSETFETSKIKELGDSLSDSQIESQLARIERATHWDLYHRTGGKEEVKLLHGSPFGDGKKPEWSSSVKENFSTSESYGGVYEFAARGEKGTVLQLTVPIRSVKMSWRTVDFGESYKNEYEYVLKSGDYSGGVKAYKFDDYLQYFKSSIRMKKSIITEGRL